MANFVLLYTGGNTSFMLRSDTGVSWRLQHTDEGGNR
jgi:hypothetical protein